MTVKIVHLFPKDALGGAETAARSMLDLNRPGFLFRIRYIAEPLNILPSGFIGIRLFGSTNNPLVYLIAVYLCVVDRPDVMIASLWRSIPVALLVKMLRPKMKLVIFLHSASPAHILDKYITLLALKVCDAVWADSASTLESRVGPRAGRKGKVISFVSGRKEIRAGRRYQGPRFVFWGRLTRDKGLDVALRFIALVRAEYQDVKFDIWGPDRGEGANIRAMIEDLGLQCTVQLKGELSRSEIRSVASSYSFYLQLSRREGMAMSVVEAMQEGLIPIVAAVGEIGSYCQTGINSLVVDPNDLQRSVEDIGTLIREPGRFEALSASAISTWADAKEYGEDVLENAARLVRQ
ncbi:glycosyltransferase family 4 protein [Mesorhizobium muleiense]|uniref:glycosyltransferase family 4 protein n=1 Tax=Mesorhizobium muleiense TaxID=1004279 RepID=UPI001F329F76|nr:glycosyltransferase [Mesorhizobium muleiense]MCF6109014.1 glycosyltransferase [Mesorhizobium muleiense]